MAEVMNTGLSDEDLYNVSALSSNLSQPTHGAIVPLSAHEHDCTDFVKFVINTVIAGTLCLLGLVGNSVSFVVLTMDKDSRVAAFLLQSLAFTDNFFLSWWFLHFTIADAFAYFDWDRHFHVCWLYVRVYSYPLLFVGQTGTIWLTVLIAASRYVAVCWPYSAPRYCSLPVITKAVLATLAFSVLYNLPRFFEVCIVLKPKAANLTEYHLSSLYTLRYTQFGGSRFYRVVYFNVFYIITSFVLPLLLLLFLNVRLTIAYRVVQRRRNSMRSRQHDHHDHSITLVMIMVVLLFIICNAPARVVQIIWHYNSYECPTGAFILNVISNVMEVLNSSSNFIIYCVFRRQFRLNLAHRICISQSHLSESDHDKQTHPPANSVQTNNGAAVANPKTILLIECKLNRRQQEAV